MNGKEILLDTTGQKIVSELNRIASAVRGETGLIYGFHINGAESNPEKAVSYLEQAVGKTPAHMNFDTGQFDYGAWENAFFMPRPCMLKYDGSVDYYLDPNDYTKKADGISASQIADTTYAGNAMMEWGQNGKKIWMKTVPSSDKKSVSVYIADTQVDQQYHAWSFINNQGKEVDHFYTPIYNGSLVEDKMRSISGQMPIHNTNATQEINYAKANNQTGDVLWYTEVMADVTLINALLILISKNLDTQAVFGYGQATYDSSETTYYGIVASGTMDKKGMFWGDRNGQPDEPGQPAGVKVFGMEHWWGNIWRRYAGHMLIDGVHKYKMTYTSKDGSTAEEYNTTGVGYISANNEPFPAGPTSNYIKEMQFEEKGPMLSLPTADGSSSTYYCDYQWWAMGVRYASRGGSVRAGSYLGAFCVYLDYVAGNAYWGIGSAVSCKPLA